MPDASSSGDGLLGRRANAYCGAYVGPPMMFTEMPECGTEFIVDVDEHLGADEHEDFWVSCPTCGAEVLVEMLEVARTVRGVRD